MLAWVVLIVAALLGAGGGIAAIAGIVLIATVFAAVYHAEVVAHRTGEPFGTLVVKNITAPKRLRFSGVNTATSSLAVTSKRGSLAPISLRMACEAGMTSCR